jgi:hypothetical protein
VFCTCHSWATHALPYAGIPARGHPALRFELRRGSAALCNLFDSCPCHSNAGARAAVATIVWVPYPPAAASASVPAETASRSTAASSSTTFRQQRLDGPRFSSTVLTASGGLFGQSDLGTYGSVRAEG